MLTASPMERSLETKVKKTWFGQLPKKNSSHHLTVYISNSEMNKINHGLYKEGKSVKYALNYVTFPYHLSYIVSICYNYTELDHHNII